MVNSTTNPKNIPGAVELYTLRITNQGSGTVDNNTLAIVDAIPVNTALDVRDAQAGLEGAFRITVANILANPLRMLAPVIASHTEPRGLIALAGILEDQAVAVIEAYAPWARIAEAARESPWVLLAGERC